MWKKNNEEQVWAARKQKQVLEKYKKPPEVRKVVAGRHLCP